MKSELAAALAQWYAEHAAIRRLWAIDDPVGLVVLVTLEPTSDGDDTMPVWLANERTWTNDLALRTRREVRLKPIVGGIDAAAVAAGAATIAELGWRDFWS